MTIDRSWSEVVDGWRHDPEFRREFAGALAAEEAPAFAWETSPSSAATRESVYRQVITPSRALAAIAADPTPFATHFASNTDEVVAFDNLGGDARLVVPAPREASSDYPHLAAFLRVAPAAQIDRLWQRVGDNIAEHWASSEAPLWVSTAGLGVHWLHVRLDRRPKYYRHAPFRTPPPSRSLDSD